MIVVVLPATLRKTTRLDDEAAEARINLLPQQRLRLLGRNDHRMKKGSHHDESAGARTHLVQQGLRLQRRNDHWKKMRIRTTC
jgi:hypothetical protein